MRTSGGLGTLAVAARGAETEEPKMSETLNEPAENDSRDWMASEFDEADYATPDEVGEIAVEVADGTQEDAAGDDAGWAATPGDEASSPEGGM